MIIGVSLLVLSWHRTGTRHSYIRSESQLAVKGLDGVLDEWVQSKFLTVLSCQLFDLVYISVS